MLGEYRVHMVVVGESGRYETEMRNSSCYRLVNYGKASPSQYSKMSEFGFDTKFSVAGGEDTRHLDVTSRSKEK